MMNSSSDVASSEDARIDTNSDARYPRAGNRGCSGAILGSGEYNAQAFRRLFPFLDDRRLQCCSHKRWTRVRSKCLPVQSSTEWSLECFDLFCREKGSGGICYER